MFKSYEWFAKKLWSRNGGIHNISGSTCVTQTVRDDVLIKSLKTQWDKIVCWIVDDKLPIGIVDN